MPTALWLLLPATLIEAVAFIWLGQPWDQGVRFTLFAATHSLSVLLSSLCFTGLLPARYQQPYLPSYLLIALLQWTMPVVGTLGLLLGLLLPLYLPRRQRVLPWQETDVPDLPFRPVDVAAQLTYSMGGLVQVIKDAGDPDKRLRAVLATRQMPDRDAIAILQFALKDPVDDVRLLAYALLDSKEKLLSESIRNYSDELPDAGGDRTVTLHRLLAQSYWELAYLGLAQGSIRNHMLNMALEHSRESYALHAQPDLLKLQGRILLELGDWEGARAVLQQGIEEGLPESHLRTYLAEIAFYEGRFEETQRQLEAYAASGKIAPAFAPVVHFWLGDRLAAPAGVAR